MIMNSVSCFFRAAVLGGKAYIFECVYWVVLFAVFDSALCVCNNEFCSLSDSASMVSGWDQGRNRNIERKEGRKELMRRW